MTGKQQSFDLSDDAWDDYIHWQARERNLLRKTNDLIKSVE
ncbi:MAG: type II toxin-antitoxin system YoeB family toxin [Lachnospiraceae bacterium]|nr:type II toxin-antitoxin system YoeB family toxin [Lachnospiraceae bacterium]